MSQMLIVCTEFSNRKFKWHMKHGVHDKTRVEWEHKAYEHVYIFILIREENIT